MKRWEAYAGSEKAEAQTFLNELFAAYGTDRLAAGALFEDFKSSAGFMDLHWPGQLIVEMKKPGVALAKADDQRIRYWQESSDAKEGIPAARFVVLCNFHEFEIWEPGRFPKEPRLRLTLRELPDRAEAFMFLVAGDVDPVFTEQRRELTAEAAEHVAKLYTSLADRGAAPVTDIQRFTMQVVWCMFAEDLGLLDGLPLSHAVEVVLKDPELNSTREFDYLFGLLNKKSDSGRAGAYAGTRYVNGDLFAEVDSPMLTRDELLHLKKAVEFDWRNVNPTIFGSLLEGVLGQERRSALGAHYTHEADIMKIVTPTIVRPWRDRIAATASPAEARALLDELCAFTVLDPACGCGNFLYVAYRELRALEYELKQRIFTLAETTGAPAPSGPLPYVPLTAVHGIDIEHVAVMIARVVLWMGHRQVMDLYGEAEAPLPLVSLPGVRAADALRAEWPQVDAIIGNPPFLGSQLLRESLGDAYLTWLKKEFGVGIKDLCVYWFRKANDALAQGQRAGLVGTNSISQNRARGASLEYVAAHGGVITDAVSSQKWPGEAKVHVSIVNWIKEPAEAVTEFDLDGARVAGITPSLTATGADTWAPQALAANKGRCFQGPIPIGKGFVMDDASAAALQSRSEAVYADIVRPYVIGDDVANRSAQDPSRWIIDFGLRPLEEAASYPAALDIVRRLVKPDREQSNRAVYRERWWIFGEPRTAMRSALSPLSRFIVGTATGKRLALAWQDAAVCPSNLVNVFAFDDDYSMGILLSRAHDAWAWAQSSTLETRLRYTPTSVFETFPWPQPTKTQREAIAEASSALYARRSELCIEHQLGLTKLYNLMDEGGFADLKALHKRLDEAVAAAYGWPKAVAQDGPELVRRLRSLNRDIVEGRVAYEPLTGPQGGARP
ncbi:DNA methyltransferase [Demequina sediminis]|uniref:DNA methyltransferase n=1 Tax=Demequina sediminis TaxID=1930058 RepID=UPI0031ED7F13